MMIPIHLDVAELGRVLPALELLLELAVFLSEVERPALGGVAGRFAFLAALLGRRGARSLLRRFLGNTFSPD